MIIGHLPAGYLVARAMQKSLGARRGIVAALLGSVAPDLDLLLFYFLDHRQVHHHDYWTHRPFFWLGLLAAIAVTAMLIRRSALWPIAFFSAGIALHMVLDTIAGSIHWYWPLSDATVTWVIVPATHSHWLLSFAHHWTFKVEIAVWIVAIVVLSADRLRHQHRA